MPNHLASLTSDLQHAIADHAACAQGTLDALGAPYLKRAAADPAAILGAPRGWSRTPLPSALPALAEVVQREGGGAAPLFALLRDDALLDGLVDRYLAGAFSANTARSWIDDLARFAKEIEAHVAAARAALPRWGVIEPSSSVPAAASEASVPAAPGVAGAPSLAGEAGAVSVPAAAPVLAVASGACAQPVVVAASPPTVGRVDPEPHPEILTPRLAVKLMGGSIGEAGLRARIRKGEAGPWVRVGGKLQIKTSAFLAAHLANREDAKTQARRRGEIMEQLAARHPPRRGALRREGEGNAPVAGGNGQAVRTATEPVRGTLGGT